jgi:iron complex outermembrane recepter protein
MEDPEMKKSPWLLATAALVAIAPPAYAQETAQEEPAADAGDIVVTATRREQALSDVPLAVSAVGSEQLQNSGVTDLRALNQLAPSLNVAGASSEANFTARIRGIGTVGENPGLESSVALFIDGVYRSRTGVGLTELGELERIEVLRGPQGTLFGRNASAGLLNVVTKKPSFDFGGYASATYGNYDYMRFEGGVTGPIVADKVAAKLEGVLMKRDGFIKQATPGQPDVNDRDRWLLRGQVYFEPSDSLNVRLIADYSKRDENCCGAVFQNPVRNLSRVSATGSGAENVLQSPNTLVPVTSALGANYQFAPNGEPFVRRTATTFPYRADSTDYGFSGEVNLDLGAAKLTSITAYRDYLYTQGQDSDYSGVDILHRTDDDRTFKTFTQELRLQGEAFDGRVDWLIGGYFAKEKLRQDSDLVYGADYEKFANCLTIAALLPSALQTSSPFCINTPVLQATAAATGNATLGALVANPARPGFGSIAAVLGQPNLAISNVGANESWFKQSSRNYAFFTHEIIDIVEDRLTLTLGARYTNERKKIQSQANFTNRLCGLLLASPFQAFSGTFCGINGTAISFNGNEPGTSRGESQWTGTANIAFKPIDDVLIYASYSKGYKSGGYNLDNAALDLPCNPTFDLGNPALGVPSCAARLAAPANTSFNARAEASDLQFDAEKVDAYEVGLKFNGRKIDVNIAAFLSKFNNYQLNTFNGLTFEVTNVQGCKDGLNGADRDNNNATGACAANRLKPGVVSKGVEIEYLITPMRDLTFSGGLTYLDSKYSKDLTGTAGRPLSRVLFQLPGSRTFGSQWSATAAVNWTPPISDNLRGLIYFDTKLISDINTGSDLDLEKVQDGYSLVNGRIGVIGPDRKWSIELWGQNLFAKKYQQIVADAPGQGSGTFAAVAAPATTGLQATANQLYIAFPGEPRTYGITARFKF